MSDAAPGLLSGGYEQGVVDGISGDGHTACGWVAADSGLFQVSCYWKSASGLWTDATGPFIITNPDPDVGQYGEAWDCSGDGSVIVGVVQMPGIFQPFRWTAAGGLVVMGTDRGQARGVSANGNRIVGFLEADTAWEACYWESSSLVRTNLGFLPGHTSSQAWSTSADGSVIVGWSGAGFGGTTGQRAFRWTAATGMVDLGVPSGTGALTSDARGVSDDGTIVAGDYATSTIGGSWKWTTSGVMSTIPIPGTSFQGVSGDGSTIVVADPIGIYLGYLKGDTVTVPPPVPLDPEHPDTIVGTQGLGISADGTVISGSTLPGTGTSKYLPLVYVLPRPTTVTAMADPASNPEWRLSVSDDGARTWSPLVKPRSTGQIGAYRTRLRWLKMGQFRQRVLKLECTDPTRRNIIGVYVDTEEGMKS